MIVARGLVKRYGSTLAVNDLSFSIRPGLFTGFLGPNGAGKTTTMLMILGLDAPTQGSVTVCPPLERELTSAPGKPTTIGNTRIALSAARDIQPRRAWTTQPEACRPRSLRRPAAGRLPRPRGA